MNAELAPFEMLSQSVLWVMTPRGIHRDPLAEGEHLILVDYGQHRMYVLEMMYREMGYQPHTERLPWLNETADT
ncbi:MAG: hypothetical protein WBE90_13775 [Xanthobacteraceae bacterium]